MSFLKKIQEKPVASRKRMAIVLTLASYAVVMFVWVSSWDARAEIEGNRDKALSPIAGISEVFHGFTSRVSRVSGELSGATLSANPEPAPAPTEAQTASATGGFDFSGIVVIEQSTSTEAMLK
ncbi:MAG: hypothetical protein UY07_C0015G0014 [Parcubacteria group bacterium GW2011_GWA1_47_8]|nr:MAG: hypothetical protein UY07_C0015G0014 [Parcubacteria group bacterium GW2011_GWA1_47_8]